MIVILELKSKWPFVKRLNELEALRLEIEHTLHAQPLWKELRHKQWVKLPDGRLGVVDHLKPDGRYACRPVNLAKGEYFPNTSHHWTKEQRLLHPEEHAYTTRELEILTDPQELPRPVRSITVSREGK